jgi:hypothetical protein
MKKPVLLLPLVLVLALCSCARTNGPRTGATPSPTPTPSPAPPATKVVRVVKTFRGTGKGTCFFLPGDCAISGGVWATVPTPAGASKFDVVVTITMDVAFSPMDTGAVYLVFCPGASVGGCPYPMPPGRFRLASSSGTTTTFSWAAKGLKADPAGWTYESFIALHDGNGDHKASASHRFTTAVWEMTPSP